MKYKRTNHPRIKDIGKSRDSFYYSCVSNKMNLQYSGNVHKQFTNLYDEITKLVSYEKEVKVFLYHALIAYKKETKGFIVPLDAKAFKSQESMHCTYYKFTTMLEILVYYGYGTLYRGSKSKEESYKSIFLMSNNFLQELQSKNLSNFPKLPKEDPNEYIIVNSEKAKNGKRTRLPSPRGVASLKKEVKVVNKFLAEFKFRDGFGNRFYPSMHRIFETDFNHYGRWYFPSQNMKSYLRKAITIEGEAVKEYDFVSNHAFLCCELANVQIDPSFRPYNIDCDHLIKTIPEGRTVREVYKLGMMCLLNCKGNYSIALKNAWCTELKGFSGKENAKDIINALQEHNILYLDEIKKQTASSLQNLDANIISVAMRYLLKRGVPFLPYHDSLLVPQSCDIAEDAMMYAWANVMGKKACCFIDRKY